MVAASAGAIGSWTWLFAATCRVSAPSSAALGTGSVRNPAFSICQTYWLAASQANEPCRGGLKVRAAGARHRARVALAVHHE